MTLRPSRLPRRALLGATLLATALLLAQGPAQGRHPDLDLDALSDARINELLQDELDPDDLADCGLDNPRAAKTKDEMFEIILCALGDGDDEDDEADLDFQDLQDEMEEAGTTVEEVVERALDRADAIASAPTTPTLWLAAAGTVEGIALPLQELPAAWVLALKDGRINPGSAAIVPVKAGVTQAVRARR